MITREDAIKELERELKMRERVYPRLLQKGKLNRTHAERQYLRLKAAIQFLQNDTEQETCKQSTMNL